MKSVKIELTTNVLIGSETYPAGQIFDFEPAVAAQIIGQGLGVECGKGEGAAASEPEPEGKEQVSPPPSPQKRGK